MVEWDREVSWFAGWLGGGGWSPAERYMAGIDVSFFEPLWIGSLVS